MAYFSDDVFFCQELDLRLSTGSISQDKELFKENVQSSFSKDQILLTTFKNLFSRSKNEGREYQNKTSECFFNANAS